MTKTGELPGLSSTEKPSMTNSSSRQSSVPVPFSVGGERTNVIVDRILKNMRIQQK
jgi:hypothetical protein